MTNQRIALMGGILLLALIAAGVGVVTTNARLDASERAALQAADGERVVPFRIQVPEAVLSDLKDRLRRTRFPDQIEGAGWDYGTNLEYLKELLTYWRETFDWRDQERRLNRFEQFVIECTEIIPGVAQALAAGEADRIGALIDRSQDAAEQLLGNQVPETIALAHLARELGAVAASAFGAGFGGSVWALVRTDRAETFKSEWAERYRSRFPDSAKSSEFFLTCAGPAMIEFEA